MSVKFINIVKKKKFIYVVWWLATCPWEPKVPFTGYVQKQAFCKIRLGNG